MKVRHGFVANSSSSGYYLAVALVVSDEEWGTRALDDFDGFGIDGQSLNEGRYGFGVTSLSSVSWREDPEAPLDFVATEDTEAYGGRYLFGTFLQRWRVAWTCEGGSAPQPWSPELDNPPQVDGQEERLQPVSIPGRSLDVLVAFYVRLAGHYGLEHFQVRLLELSGE